MSTDLTRIGKKARKEPDLVSIFLPLVIQGWTTCWPTFGMVNRGAGCMGNPLVRFWEGPGNN